MESRTFRSVDAELWARLQALGQREHGTTFEEGQDNCGTATTPTPLGPVVLRYSYDQEQAAITYTLVRRPMLAPSSLIWNGIATTIERCRNEPSGTA